MSAQSTSLTHIIQQWQAGDKEAESQLYQFAYLQLRKIAQQERERNAEKYGLENEVLADSVNSTTALIHDAYLKLSTSDMSEISGKRDFFPYGSQSDAPNLDRQCTFAAGAKTPASDTATE